MIGGEKLWMRRIYICTRLGIDSVDVSESGYMSAIGAKVASIRHASFVVTKIVRDGCGVRCASRKEINMLSKRDYFLMAEVFREVYLSSRTVIYHDHGELYRTILQKFMKMLQEDNPRFNPEYFTNYIVYGRCKPKSLSGEAQA